MSSGYDIVGDVHGRFDAFMTLVSGLGYSMQGDGSLRHEDGDRQLILVGDIINKGTQNAEMIDAARASVDAGTMQVVLGNHEFFNVCYARKDEDGAFLVEHSEKADAFLKTFLDEFPLGTQMSAEAIDWLAARPIYVDLPDVTVAHAMHNQEDLWRVSAELNDDNSFKPTAFERHSAVVRAHISRDQHDDARFFGAVERLVYGVALRSPDDLREQGFPKRMRLRWWEGENANAVRLLDLDGARLDQGLVDDLSHRMKQLRHHAGHSLVESEKLLAYGHYSLKREPEVVSDKALCLDFKGADERGILTAYRFNHGDAEFHDEQLESVDAPFENDLDI